MEMNNNHIIEQDKSKIAIVVVGYNRLNSIERLLGSLSRAHYEAEVPLVISIDASGCQPLYDYVKRYQWKFGKQYVLIKEKRLGLREHILSCGDLTQYFKAVVILEDDIFVSEYFYDYVQSAVNKYGDDSHVGGISLFRPKFDRNYPIEFEQDGNDVFAYQTVESWGECWTENMWKGFREWYNDTPDHDFSTVDMPEFMKNWKKAWSKFYMAYQIENNKYFIYPSVSYTTCFADAGVHGGESSVGQVLLSTGKRNYSMPEYESLSKYDIYGTNEKVYQWLGYDKDDICVDFYGLHDRCDGHKFLLTPYKCSSFKVNNTFALSLHPMELNVKYKLDGDGLFLYDIAATPNSEYKRQITPLLSSYMVGGFNIYVLFEYVVNFFKGNWLRKLKSFF